MRRRLYRLSILALGLCGSGALIALPQSPGRDQARAAPPVATPGVPAFPGAQGAGASSRGGRGGKVFIVTSLADSGRGSLRECVEAAGPRTCVFAVGGTITLRTTLYVTNPFLTVAGQTAPGGGVQLTNARDATEQDLSSLVLISTHDVIWTYTRLRNQYRRICADNRSSECGGLFGIETNEDRETYNIIASNNSLSWNQDEGFDIWSGVNRPLFNVTLSMNLIAEGLDSHSTGMLTGGGREAFSSEVYNIDFHHNLVMNNSHRNPLMTNRSGRLVNNIFYNQFYYVSQFGGGGRFDVVGNYYKPGPMTRPRLFHEVQGFSSAFSDAVAGAPSLYLVGNRGWNQAEPRSDQWAMTRRVQGENGRELGPMPASWRRREPLPATRFPITAEPVAVIAGADGPMVRHVGASRRLDCAGAWVDDRDAVDARLVRQYVENRGVATRPRGSDAFTRLSPVAGGPACVDEDRDGMPDAWERARFGDLRRGPAEDADQDGYTNLEAFLYAIPGEDPSLRRAGPHRDTETPSHRPG
jgi:pectate lyase